MAKFFAVKTLDFVGIGDQLGTQFSRLHLLGKALGLQYLHLSPNFERSFTSAFSEQFCKKILAYKVRLMDSKANLTLKTLGVNVLTFFEKVVLKIDKKISGHTKIQQFLGLNYNDKLPEKIEFITVGAYLIGADSKEVLIKEILNALGSEIETLVLCWDQTCYSYTDKFDSFFNNGNYIKSNSFIKEALLRTKNISKPTAESIVLHIRRGDNVSFSLEGATLQILGNEVLISEEGRGIAADGDGNRKMASIESYLNFLEHLTSQIGEKNTKITVLTDGYLRSKQILLNYYVQNYTKLRASHRQGIIEILKTDLDKKYILDKFQNLPLDFVIGENFENLKKSIKKIATADVLVFGNGGFAFFLHAMYNLNPVESKVFHVSELNELAVQTC